MFHNDNGFTLVEILIAALILFATLAVSTLIFHTAARTEDRIAAQAALSTALPNIMELIKDEITAGQEEGQGQYSSTVSYHWRVTSRESSKNVTSAYEETTGKTAYGNFQLQLNTIRVRLRYQRYALSREISHEYKELSWQREASTGPR
ncbi:MAG: hypothetical protein BZ151_12405 [Desulfobacca sp. 4484_104]|nr:MAG: hypothetical protein BZ151_12405 [Desulfobacca sp. 4484_104]